MRFTLQHPLASRACSPAMLEPANVIRLAQATEAAGLDALAFTEHPAPSQKWLSSGGHDSLDPLTALAFCAAATQRIALMPYLLVLPYRNPVLAAKQIATLDVLSGGRVILGVGNGYLRSEFSALGVDFDERSALLDEGLEVLRGIWTQDSFAFTGRHFRVLAQTAHPRPVQQPSPPVWIGGNSASARDRVVRAGQGWTPLLLDGPAAQMLRTPPIPTVADLRVAIQDLHARAERAGRDPAGIAVQIEGAGTTAMDGDPAHRLEQIAELAAAGVTWLVVEPPGDDIDHALEVIAAYGRDILQQLPEPCPISSTRKPEPMQLEWTTEEQALRAELRDLVTTMLPTTWGHGDRDLATAESAAFSAAFCAQAAERGLLTPAWPVAYGGRGASLWDQLVVSEELWGSGEPRGPQYMGVNWIGPALMAVGTPEQREEHLPPIAAGKSLWCQGFSEPDAGSDLAALRTRAVREGDSYVVNGQKVWTSYAHTAKHCFVLARTEVTEDPRQGISVLLVPMDTPGIEVREIPSLSEHLVHEIFFTDAVVPVSCRLGDEGGAWSLIRTVLANERFGAARHEHGSRMLDAIVEEAADGGGELDDRDWEHLGRAAAAVEATRLLNYAAVDAAVRGAQDAGGTTSVYRVQVGLMEHLLADVFCDVLGAEALVHQSRGDFQQAMATTSTIAAGSLEMHLNAVARAGLGLPKGR